MCLLATGAQADWRTALPGWKYAISGDHGNHPEFKTEWWYFSGNLTAADGRAFGYQLTFFRQGVMPLDADIIPLSHFVTTNVKFAHFAVSDLSGSAFHFSKAFSRRIWRGGIWHRFPPCLDRGLVMCTLGTVVLFGSGQTLMVYRSTSR